MFGFVFCADGTREHPVLSASKEKKKKRIVESFSFHRHVSFFLFPSLIKTSRTSLHLSPPDKKNSDATSPANDDDSVFRILISSDNHLGAWEKDEIRKNDSFAAFDEVFRLATEHRADVVLLGGDLFHDNRPSRATVVKAMSTLSRHCLVRPRGTGGGGMNESDEEADGNDADREEPKVSIVNRVEGLLAG